MAHVQSWFSFSIFVIRCDVHSRYSIAPHGDLRVCVRHTLSLPGGKIVPKETRYDLCPVSLNWQSLKYVSVARGGTYQPTSHSCWTYVPFPQYAVSEGTYHSHSTQLLKARTIPTIRSFWRHVPFPQYAAAEGTYHNLSTQLLKARTILHHSCCRHVTYFIGQFLKVRTILRLRHVPFYVTRVRKARTILRWRHVPSYV